MLKIVMTGTDSNNYEKLIVACRKADLKAIEETFKEFEPDVNLEIGPNKSFLLIEASRNPHSAENSVLKFLISKGADISIVNEY